MPTTYKVLGQSAPSATTLTTLYTVPSATQAVVSSIVVANLAATAATFRIAVRPAGASIATSQYVGYDITLGVTMGATDVLSVYSSTATVTFSAFGSEIS
jgi:glucose-6-phosphate dehydrogenase assembly protein OpcA